MATPVTAQAQLAYRPESPLSIPTFTCSNATEPALTTGARTDPGQVLNTNAISFSDRGNQPRWAYAFIADNPGSHTIPQTTAGETEDIPMAFTIAGNTMPTTLSGLPALAWQHFSGREVFAYNGGTAVSPQLASSQSLSSVGFYLANPNGGAAANQTRLLRYQFYLAPEADAASYQLSLTGVAADDSIAGYYINGVLSGSSPTLGGGASPELQWKTGLNTLTVALYDTIPSATRLTIGGASASACVLSTLAVTVVVQNPVITTEQTEVFSGLATSAAPGGTSKPLPIGTAVTLTLSGPNGYSNSQTTTVTGNAGEYSLVWPAGLAPGDYQVIATLSAQPTVQSAMGSFVVEAVIVPPKPIAPQAVPALGLWSVVGMGSLIALLSRRRLRRRQH